VIICILDLDLMSYVAVEAIMDDEIADEKR
jgi:hypothetical protein